MCAVYLGRVLFFRLFIYFYIKNCLDECKFMASNVLLLYALVTVLIRTAVSSGENSTNNDNKHFHGKLCIFLQFTGKAIQRFVLSLRPGVSGQPFVA